MNTEEYIKAEAQLHVASQIISLTGKNFVAPNPDDSHTTAKWDTTKNHIVGRALELNGNRYSIFVDPVAFSFGINKNGIELDRVELNGLTYMQTVEPWKKWLEDAGSKGELDLSLHYELPASDLYRFDAFSKPSESILKSWVDYRTLANQAFQELIGKIGIESDINIWPHHFDTGTYHILHESDGEGDRSIGAGFNPADEMVPEPYFYIYGWYKDRKIDYSDAPLIEGARWITDNWEGCILPMSSINENRLEQVNEFYRITSEYLKNKNDSPAAYQ
ncbi:MAG: hypothetical protein ACI9FU_002256 [Granulosicoccus sp.]|jgi:hypothetical protein